MAMTAPVTQDIPKFILVSEYTVRRIGKYPIATVVYMECSYLLGTPLSVVSALDTNADGLVDAVIVLDLGASPAVVGHILSDLQSNVLTTISATERIEVTPAIPPTEMNPAGTAATYQTKLTFAQGIAQAAAPMAIVEKMPVGTTAYRPTPGGRTWTVTLHGQNVQAMAEMGNLLGGVYFTSAKTLLTKLGVTGKTDAEIVGAIQALAAEGTNIDGMLAQQGEVLEGKRKTGQLAFAQVMGLAA